MRGQRDAGVRRLHLRDVFRSARRDQLPARAAALGTEVDDVVRGADDVEVVLDDDHRVALVDQGNTVVVIEHNLDVIKTADWIIDLGPEGGDEGGRIVAEGTPEQVAQAAESPTGAYLKRILGDARRSGRAAGAAPATGTASSAGSQGRAVAESTPVRA